MEPTLTAAHAALNGRPEDLGWFVLLLPLAAAAAILCGAGRSRVLTLFFSLGSVFTAFALSWALFFTFGLETHESRAAAIPWFHAGGVDISFGLTLDRLSTLMLLVVTGVSSAVHVFSVGYMAEDRDFSRFFGSLGLFTFAMLGVVLADNLVMIFFFWELVGVASYLLIGFWHEREAAADAAKKAFLVNRVGDFGFIVGILLVGSLAGTFEFRGLAAKLATSPGLFGAWGSVAGLLIFCGAMGKSAQFPLHVWLPDAMEGPTPVSALIHAATMVAAGVYLLCRVYFLYLIPTSWPGVFSWFDGVSALDVIAWIGGVTALFAALVALRQDDIKRILAYSTLSQLGYMVMAVGVGGPDAAMYHLTTHAAFKALLFLAAGAVIHGCHHEQDIWKLGGLWRKLPITFRTFAIGAAALAGLPVITSGFYSKDAILVAAVRHGHPVLFAIGVGVAALTTFYMLRLAIVAFGGGARSEAAAHAQEGPALMTWPLVALAIPSVASAWLPLGDYLHAHFFGAGGEESGLFGPFNHAPLASLFGTGAILFGASAAFRVYWGAESDPLTSKLGWFGRALGRRLWVDEFYQAVPVALHDLAATVANWVDRWLVAGLMVRGIQGSVELVGRAVRLAQTGNLQTYSFLFVFGVALAAILVLR